MKKRVAILVSCLTFLGLSACSPKEKPQPTEQSSFDKYYQEGLVLTGQERHAEAEIPYRKALEANPNSPDAANNLGWSLAKQGKYKEAIPYFEKAIQLNPNYQLAKNNLKWAQEELNKLANPETNTETKAY